MHIYEYLERSVLSLFCNCAPECVTNAGILGLQGLTPVQCHINKGFDLFGDKTVNISVYICMCWKQVCDREDTFTLFSVPDMYGPQGTHPAHYDELHLLYR